MSQSGSSSSLSYSFSSSSGIDCSRSFANVLRSKSLSNVPRFRDWYTSRDRRVSTCSPCRGIGVGWGTSAGERVFTSCSGVLGSTHGSLRLRVVEENDRAEFEVFKRILSRTALRLLNIVFDRRGSPERQAIDWQGRGNWPRSRWPQALP